MGKQLNLARSWARNDATCLSQRPLQYLQEAAETYEFTRCHNVRNQSHKRTAQGPNKTQQTEPKNETKNISLKDPPYKYQRNHRLCPPPPDPGREFEAPCCFQGPALGRSGIGASSGCHLGRAAPPRPSENLGNFTELRP